MKHLPAYVLALSAQTPALSDDLIPAASRLAAPDFTLTDVNGKALTLSQYKGRVVLLDFWATTCGGCKVELPWYVSFDKQYRQQGLSVIGLDMYGETPEVIKPFMAKWNMTYPIAVGTDALGERFHLREMPLTLLIDRTGKIAPPTPASLIKLHLKKTSRSCSSRRPHRQSLGSTKPSSKIRVCALSSPI